MRYCLLPLALALFILPAAAQAQVSPTGLISPEVARQFGLERMWFTHLHVDRGRGRIAGLHMHVSDTQAHTVFQITHDGRRYAFRSASATPSAKRSAWRARSNAPTSSSRRLKRA